MATNNSDHDISTLHQHNIDVKNREIFLHSPTDYDEESGVEYRSAISFEKNVRYLNLLSLDPILVHMHIPGGDWQDCMAIFDTVTYSKAPIAILAYAKVESASGILFQSAPLRIMMPSANMLIHYGSLALDAEHKAAIATFAWSQKESQKMINIFTEKCMGSPVAEAKNWKKMMVKRHIVSQLDSKSDWILDAEESVDYGFADGVLGSRKFPNIDTIKSALSKSKKKR